MSGLRDETQYAVDCGFIKALAGAAMVDPLRWNGEADLRKAWYGVFGIRPAMYTSCCDRIMASRQASYETLNF